MHIIEIDVCEERIMKRESLLIKGLLLRSRK